MSAEVRITIDDHAADEEGHESMSIALREEILSTDVEDVRLAPSGLAPDGTRGVDATAINQLLVTLPASLAARAALVNTVRTVELTVGERSLKLARASSDDQQRLIEEFLRSVQSDSGSTAEP